VRFLVDAQLPDRLADRLTSLGHDVVHTSELADGNRTKDAEIIGIADRDERIVITKDHDFLDGHLLNHAPQRLLLVTTGNIRNDDLIALIEAVEPLLVGVFEHSLLVEVNRDTVIGH
jgi:predicted nuclease of predicted toxin-antitoxin system